MTGPVSHNMEIALQRTYNATPLAEDRGRRRRLRLHGGIFGESYASLGAVSNVIPVDVCIPGCPPTPVALLQGILKAISTER